ncbi:hypothetical protein B4Q13_21485, partial [Lacticaseibacillus rhamnosus]
MARAGGGGEKTRGRGAAGARRPRGGAAARPRAGGVTRPFPRGPGGPTFWGPGGAPPPRLWINRHDGTFVDEALLRGYRDHVDTQIKFRHRQDHTYAELLCFQLGLETAYHEKQKADRAWKIRYHCCSKNPRWDHASLPRDLAAQSGRERECPQWVPLPSIRVRGAARMRLTTGARSGTLRTPDRSAPVDIWSDPTLT